MADLISGDLVTERLESLLTFELLLPFVLFPPVITGADRLNLIESTLPVSIYYLSLAIAAGFALVLLYRSGVPNQWSLFLIAAYVLFTAWAVLSYFWTLDTTGYAEYKLPRMVIFNTLLLGFGLVIAQSKRRIVRMALVVGLLGIWLTLEGIYASYILGERAFVTTGAQTYLTPGRAIGLALPLLTYLTLCARSTTLRIISGSMTVTLLIGLLTMGSRGPFVSLIIGLGVYAVLETVVRVKEGSIAPRQVSVVTVGSGIAVGIVGAIFWLTSVMPRTIERLLITGPSDSATTARIDMILDALGLWTEAPLLGHGIGSYREITGHVYPHNIYVESLAELGLIGFLLLAVLIVLPVVTVVFARFRSGDPLFSAILATIVFMLVNASLSFDLQANRQLFFLLGMATISFAYHDQDVVESFRMPFHKWRSARADSGSDV